MIIGIDITSIPYGTGVSNYTLNLVKNLVKIGQKHTFKLFFSSLRQPLPQEIKKLSTLPNVKIYHYRFPITFLEYVWNRLHTLPIELLIGKCDVFHTSDWTQPPTQKAITTTTVHDLTPFLFPQWLHPRIVAVHTRKMKLSIKESKAFICVSQNTRNDLLKIFPQVNSIQTVIIPEAAEAKYDQPLSLQQKKRYQVMIEKQYGLKKYILAQGTREPRKNLSRLVEAFIKFKKNYPKSELELAIAGKYGWGHDITSHHPSVKILGFIPETHMLALHAAAFCLAYPSLYEGFGLPLVKALKLGLPIITSNTSSLPEVAQDAAIYVNPEKVSSLYLAIKKIVKDPILYQTLSHRGPKIGAQYSWSHTATQTLKFYQQLVKL